MGAITIDMSRYTGISSRYTLVPMSMSNKEYIDAISELIASIVFKSFLIYQTHIQLVIKNKKRKNSNQPTTAAINIALAIIETSNPYLITLSLIYLFL